MATQRQNIATALIKGAKVSPRKAMMVADQIRGMKVVQALAILEHTRKASNSIMQKVLQSAVANAVQKDSSVNPDELVVTEARVDQGKMLKRMQARAMGRGVLVRKKTSHIRLSVG